MSTTATRHSVNDKILDPATYAEPSVSFAETEVTVPAEQVRVGDIHEGIKVSSVKSGSKWTYLRNDGGKVIAEVQNREPVKVTRREATPDYSAEQLRMRANRALAERLAGRYGTLKSVQARLNEDLDKNGALDYSALSRLLQVQADLKILNEFVDVAQRSTDGEDLVDIMREFADHLAHRLVRESRNKSISRSPNMLANLIEDVERDSMAEFIEKSRWAF